ncbi:AraC family transcriptional regulator [Paenibacillaceae bacterium]|nr:AraC family transcriptional regulator [Paenibacillaceae bacterium]
MLLNYAIGEARWVVMKPLQHLTLSKIPFQFAYRRTNGSTYKDIVHLHEGVEFFYIEQGEGEVEIGSSILTVKAGDLLFFQPFQLHKLSMQATDLRPFVRSFAVYNPEWLQPFLRPFPQLTAFHQMIWKRTWERQLFRGLLPEHPVIRHLQRLHAMPAAETATERELEPYALFLIGMLDLLNSHWEQKQDNSHFPAPQQRCSGHTELAMEWIEHNYMKPFQLQQLADQLHLSATYLSGLFRKEIGAKLSDYLAARRIKEACLLLNSSSLALDQIAYRIGICNVSYFCQLFKKHTGETPHRYRMKYHLQADVRSACKEK